MHEALDYARLAGRYSARNARYQQRLGDLSLRAGHLVEARRAYQRVLDLRPGDQRAKLALATTLLDLGDHEQSRELIAKVPGSVRGRAEYRLLTARLALAAGRTNDARRLAAEGFGGADDPRVLRSIAELHLGLADAGAVSSKTATRRIEGLIAKLRKARAIKEAEELTAHLDRLRG